MFAPAWKLNVERYWRLTSRKEKIQAPKINASNRAKCASCKRVTWGDEATILAEPGQRWRWKWSQNGRPSLDMWLQIRCLPPSSPWPLQSWPKKEVIPLNYNYFIIIIIHEATELHTHTAQVAHHLCVGAQIEMPAYQRVLLIHWRWWGLMVSKWSVSYKPEEKSLSLRTHLKFSCNTQSSKGLDVLGRKPAEEKLFPFPLMSVMMSWGTELGNRLRTHVKLCHAC